ncbi:hypothetical protein D3C80_1628090 [compost metagenome]
MRDYQALAAINPLIGISFNAGWRRYKPAILQTPKWLHLAIAEFGQNRNLPGRAGAAALPAVARLWIGGLDSFA